MKFTTKKLCLATICLALLYAIYSYFFTDIIEGNTVFDDSGLQDVDLGAASGPEFATGTGTGVVAGTEETTSIFSIIAQFFTNIFNFIFQLFGGNTTAVETADVAEDVVPVALL